MNWLRHFLDRQKHYFEQDGPLHRWQPVFEAADSFFFSSSKRTPHSPHIRDPLDVKRYMSLVIVALIPSLFMGVYLFGLRVIAMIVVAYAVGGLIEVGFAVVRREEINEGFLVTGLILPLTLPPAIPLWMVGVGSAVAVVIGKEMFGGTGRNLFNPALVGRCFLALSYPETMTTKWIQPGSGLTGRLAEYVSPNDLDVITSATPLVNAKQGDFAAAADLVIGTVPGSIAETSVIAILLGGVFLLVTGIINWRTVVSCFAAFFVFGWMFHYLDPASFGPIIWHLGAGGLMFGFFFMATDPVTGPGMDSAKWVYGIIIGLSTVLIRNLTGFVEGVMFAILLANIAAPVLDEVAVRMKLRKL